MTRANVLFLCTGNSARSILAEAIVNRMGADRFAGHSAGSHPKGSVHPQAIALLGRLEYPTDGLRSKSWDEFAAPGAPQMDFIVTVCDNAAGEVCPIWPGRPVTAHWGIPDPAAVQGSADAIARAFADAYRQLEARVGRFVDLPVAGLDKNSLQKRLTEIGSPHVDI